MHSTKEKTEELRSVIFYFTYINNKYILLHGFIKKTLATPPREIEKALVYMKDYIRRNQDE